ncbi:hypothetical protein DPMN_160265 [Dreissena polymorpha]|uniref:Uncharacterized protein n=1 Tax=Dreissena polymorpha TaxID=45954 RepID=A0A9D4ELY7_DREPO|nr:hypothetical protein DPMN_160265 [Dreissena polymorpha]
MQWNTGYARTSQTGSTVGVIVVAGTTFSLLLSFSDLPHLEGVEPPQTYAAPEGVPKYPFPSGPVPLAERGHTLRPLRPSRPTAPRESTNIISQTQYPFRKHGGVFAIRCTPGLQRFSGYKGLGRSA